MRQCDARDDAQELAALYALGSLSQQEARAFERHIEEGCETCKSELAAFDSTVEALGFSATAQSPSAAVRDRLLNAVALDEQRAEAKKPSGGAMSTALLSIRAGEGKWREVCEGIFVKRLFVDKATGNATSLVKMLPDTRLPRHKHPGAEQIFVLEGDCRVNGEALGPGDYHCARAGSIHNTTYTVGGTSFLLVAPEHYEQLQPG